MDDVQQNAIPKHDLKIAKEKEYQKNKIKEIKFFGAWLGVSLLWYDFLFSLVLVYKESSPTNSQRLTSFETCRDHRNEFVSTNKTFFTYTAGFETLISCLKNLTIYVPIVLDLVVRQLGSLILFYDFFFLKKQLEMF